MSLVENLHYGSTLLILLGLLVVSISFIVELMRDAWEDKVMRPMALFLLLILFLLLTNVVTHGIMESRKEQKNDLNSGTTISRENR